METAIIKVNSTAGMVVGYGLQIAGAKEVLYIKKILSATEVEVAPK